MKKRVLALLLAVVLVVGCFAACNNNNTTNNSTAPANNGTNTTTPATNDGGSDSGNDAPAGPTSAGPDDTSETYSFTVYYNYTGWTKSWGADEASKYMSEKFNIDINWYGPDSDPDAKLNLMVSSDDLPEMVVMDRGPTLNNIAAQCFQDLSQYMYEGNYYSENVTEATRNLLKIDGVLYGIPNWARTMATGGNWQWMVNGKAYEALGTPTFETIEDLHQYALAAKEANLTSYTGQSVYPIVFGPADAGYYIYFMLYRAQGAPNIIDSYYTQEDNKIAFCLDSEKFVAALKMANQWFNEGLYSAETFTDSTDQFLEKVTNGRAALLAYDFSQDDGNNFRRTVINNSNGEDTYEVQGYSYKYDTLMGAKMFPGIEKDTITFGDEAGTVGWNVNCITKKAANPQRIFDWCSWMITKEGSVNMMYGPEGGTMLASCDYSGEVPVPTLKKPASEFTDEEQNATGAWFWSQPANADWVDLTKFGLNNLLAPEDQNWVVAIQANMCSLDEKNPLVGSKFINDGNTGLTDTIKTGSDEAIARQQIIDQCKQLLPQIMQASSDAEFDSKVEELRSFAHNNGVEGILKLYQEKHDANMAIQGYDPYSAEYNLYKL